MILIIKIVDTHTRSIEQIVSSVDLRAAFAWVQYGHRSLACFTSEGIFYLFGYKTEFSLSVPPPSFETDLVFWVYFGKKTKGKSM